MPTYSKRSTRNQKAKPEKPSPTFPLFAYASGQWCKKFRGRTFYFGKWDDPQSALRKFERDWPYISDGRVPPNNFEDGEDPTLNMVCNRFLHAKRNKLQSGELAKQTWADYHKTCERLIDHFGKHRRVDDLRPIDFEQYRRKLSRQFGINTLKN